MYKRWLCWHVCLPSYTTSHIILSFHEKPWLMEAGRSQQYKIRKILPFLRSLFWGSFVIAIATKVLGQLISCLVNHWPQPPFVEATIWMMTNYWWCAVFWKHTHTKMGLVISLWSAQLLPLDVSSAFHRDKKRPLKTFNMAFKSRNFFFWCFCDDASCICTCRKLHCTYRPRDFICSALVVEKYLRNSL